CRAVIGDRDSMSESFDDELKSFKSIGVVFDNQHGKGVSSLRRRGRQLGFVARQECQRKRDDKRSSLSGSFAADGDLAAVHLHQCLDESEPDAETAARTGQAMLALLEHIEDSPD